MYITDAHANQAKGRIANGRGHFAQLPEFPLGKGDTDPGARPMPFQPYFSICFGKGRYAFQSLNGTGLGQVFLARKTDFHTILHGRYGLIGDYPVELSVIFLFHSRAVHRIRHFPVGGEQ